MSDLKNWSNAAGTAPTVGATTPDYMPENDTAVSQVNNWGREAQAAVRRFYEAIEWRDFGHTTTFVSSGTPAGHSVFSVTAGKGSMYNVGQRAKVVHNSGGTTTNCTITAIATDNITVDVVLVATVDSVAVGPAPAGQFGDAAVTGTILTVGANDEAAVDGAGKAGTIDELVTDAGVTVEAMLIKDGAPGAGTPAQGDVYYGGASGVLTKLPKGTDGQALILVSGVPAWGDTAQWSFVETLNLASGSSWEMVNTINPAATQLKVVIDDWDSWLSSETLSMEMKDSAYVTTIEGEARAVDSAAESSANSTGSKNPLCFGDSTNGAFITIDLIKTDSDIWFYRGAGVDQDITGVLASSGKFTLASVLTKLRFDTTYTSQNGDIHIWEYA